MRWSSDPAIRPEIGRDMPASRRPFPEHEILLEEGLRQVLGDGIHVSLSHEVVGTFREYERAATTEVDAALSPLLGSYLSSWAKDAVKWVSRNR